MNNENKGWKKFEDGMDWLPPELHDIHDEYIADPSPLNLRKLIKTAYDRGRYDGFVQGENSTWENLF